LILGQPQCHRSVFLLIKQFSFRTSQKVTRFSVQFEFKCWNIIEIEYCSLLPLKAQGERG
jgi:hypothetical protein